MRQPRALRAVRDPDGGLVKDDVDPVHRLEDQAGVTDVTLDDADLPRRHRRFEILHPAPREVVEDDDLLEALGYQAVGDVRADESGAARDQCACIGHAVSCPAEVWDGRVWLTLRKRMPDDVEHELFELDDAGALAAAIFPPGVR